MKDRRDRARRPSTKTQSADVTGDSATELSESEQRLTEARTALLARGVVAGWLIALMVWMMPGADSSRAFIIVVMTYIVALGSLPHGIAGSVDGFFLVACGAMPLRKHAWRVPDPGVDRKYYRRGCVGRVLQPRTGRHRDASVGDWRANSR